MTRKSLCHMATAIWLFPFLSLANPPASAEKLQPLAKTHTPAATESRPVAPAEPPDAPIVVKKGVLALDNAEEIERLAYRLRQTFGQQTWDEQAVGDLVRKPSKDFLERLDKGDPSEWRFQGSVSPLQDTQNLDFLVGSVEGMLLSYKRQLDANPELQKKGPKQENYQKALRTLLLSTNPLRASYADYVNSNPKLDETAAKIATETRAYLKQVQKFTEDWKQYAIKPQEEALPLGPPQSPVQETQGK